MLGVEVFDLGLAEDARFRLEVMRQKDSSTHIQVLLVGDR